MKTMKKKTELVKKPSKTELLAAETCDAWTDQHSSTIRSQIRIARVQAEELDKRITALSAALVTARDERANVSARIQGLTTAVNKRR